MVVNERNHWNELALDPDVDKKYISDLPDDKYKHLLDFKGNVLEIGCGVGRLLKNGWYGIDISDEMCKIAKQRKPKAIILQNDGRTVPFDDNLFDAVYSILVFQHIPFEAVKSYIEEAYRVLKPGGMFIFQFIAGDEDEPYSKHHPLPYVIYEVEDLFKEYSLDYGLGNYNWTWVVAKK